MQLHQMTHPSVSAEYAGVYITATAEGSHLKFKVAGKVFARERLKTDCSWVKQLEAVAERIARGDIAWDMQGDTEISVGLVPEAYDTHTDIQFRLPGDSTQQFDDVLFGEEDRSPTEGEVLEIPSAEPILEEQMPSLEALLDGGVEKRVFGSSIEGENPNFWLHGETGELHPTGFKEDHDAAAERLGLGGGPSPSMDAMQRGHIRLTDNGLWCDGVEGLTGALVKHQEKLRNLITKALRSGGEVQVDEWPDASFQRGKQHSIDTPEKHTEFHTQLGKGRVAASDREIVVVRERESLSVFAELEKDPQDDLLKLKEDLNTQGWVKTPEPSIENEVRGG